MIKPFIRFCYILIVFLPALVYANHATHPLIKPKALQPGDTIGLIASASPIDEDINIQYAAERMQALGLKVKFGKSIFNREGYLAGSDEQRAADLNDMFADNSVKAIIELRGGWGSN